MPAPARPQHAPTCLRSGGAGPCSCHRPGGRIRDVFDVFVTNLHDLLGHDAAARYLGFPEDAGPQRRAECLLCHPELAAERGLW